MTSHRLVMPQLGQAMEFGTIAEWLAADGAAVRAGQPIASVESDKATYEIEATADGVLHHLAAVGDEVPIGQPLASIGDSSAGPQGAYAIPPEAVAASAATAPARPEPTIVGAGGRTLASPKARALARSLGVDLATVAAHRADGLIVSGDVTAAAEAGRVLASPKARGLADSLGVDIKQVAAHRADRLVVASDVEAAAAARKAPARPAGDGVPLTRLRRVGADRLARSWRQAPHFVQMIEIEATRLTAAVARLRKDRAPGGLNDILIKVAADCLAQFPTMNARFDDGRLVPIGQISIGLAVATDEGLTVPVVRGADQLPLAAIAAASRELVLAARANKLTGQQIGGASLTISNLGHYGITFGTPVLNLDEPILIFVGAIEERAVVRDGQVVARAMTTLSVCYDHRAVDGLQAALFSRALKQRLESLDGIVPAEPDEDGPDAAALAPRALEASSAADSLAVSVRGGRHRWTVDEPADIGGEDTGPDPVTLVLGGLLSCMIIAFKLAARRRKVAIDEVRGSLTATPEGKVKTVTLRLEVWSLADAAEVEKLLAPAKAMCLVHDMLKPELAVEVQLVVRAVGGE